MMNECMTAVRVALAACLGCILFACGAPPPYTAPFFRRGVLELGRLAGDKVELREYRGKWLQPTVVDLDRTEKPDGALGFASGLIMLRRGRALSFFAPTGMGWYRLEERGFTVPRGCRAVLDFEADALALAFGRLLKVYRFDDSEGWREDASLRMTLPRSWQAVFNVGFTSIGVVAGGTATLMQRRGRGWEEAPYGSFAMPDGWHSIFGFQANGVGIELKSEVVFMQYLEGGWRTVPEATMGL